MVHQQRLIDQVPQTYVPVKTSTTRQEPKAGDDIWFDRISKADMFKISFEDMLTLYEERNEHYVVSKRHVSSARTKDRTIVIGMSPSGLAHIVARQERDRHLTGDPVLDFRAIILRPESTSDFVDMLIRDRGLTPDIAEEEAERADRLSDIPDEVRSPSIFPVSVRGDARDIVLVDETIRAALPP